MDPASATGIAFGAVTLAFDVFDRAVGLFKFFSSMVDMPKEYERCRIQLMIEYNRLLAWGDAVGLVNDPNGSHIASRLGTDAIELCSIVSHIGSLLQKFRDINIRWRNEGSLYSGDNQAIIEPQTGETSLNHQVSSLSIAYEKEEKERERVRWTNHLVKWMSRGAGNVKEIINHPLRVRWVTVDKEAFEALLKDLHSLTERLHELFGDYREQQIHEITAKTYREMVILRNELNELKVMFDAVTSLIQLSTSAGTSTISYHDENHETLRDLLRLKEIRCVSDEILQIIGNDADFDVDKYLRDTVSVSQYEGAMFSDHFTYTGAEDTNHLSQQHRLRGVLTKEGKNYEVWVEWRTADFVPNNSVENKESRLRTAVLAQMLSSDKPRNLFSPTCIGLVDDRERRNRFGWIFKMPEGSHRGTLLKTLHSVLGQDQIKPTLAQRISLAWKLASSLLYLHTANWLHKGIHSGNVIFSCEKDKFDVENPILSGFEYSRPQSNKTTSRSLEPKWDIYRWPGIQNEAPKAGCSRKTYDIYSIGLVLLEIAHWEPLHKLMCLKRWPVPSNQDARIRGWLLEEEPFPPFKNGNPLTELRNIAGDKYWNATKRCLIAHGEWGMRIREENDQSRCSQIGIELQATFSKFVVEELKGVSV